MSAKWQTAHGAEVPQASATSFSIIAPPETDIWRRSDEDDVFNAPMVFQSMKASEFKKIDVTVFAGWKTQYDQGGLFIAFPSASGDVRGSKWIKAGIEFFSLEPVIGIVGTDRYSDWSLAPMRAEYHQKATFSAVREGTTLWIYAAQAGADKLAPMREIKWAFMEGREQAEVWVGVYAAKPTPEEGDANEETKGLEVMFSDLSIEREEK